MATHDWLSMGGYAAYVWPAYGVTLVVIGTLTAMSMLDHRAKKQKLKKMQPSHQKDDGLSKGIR